MALLKVKADNRNLAHLHKQRKPILRSLRRAWQPWWRLSSPNKKTRFNIRSATRFITGCDDKERVSEHIMKQIVDVLFPVVREEIVEGIRSTSQERIRECTTEKIMDAPVSQVQERMEQSTFESQSSVSHAGTSCRTTPRTRSPKR